MNEIADVAWQHAAELREKHNLNPECCDDEPRTSKLNRGQPGEVASRSKSDDDTDEDGWKKEHARVWSRLSGVIGLSGISAPSRGN